jgi:hypothetical protein
MQKKMRMELAYKPKKSVESSCAKDINANLGAPLGAPIDQPTRPTTVMMLGLSIFSHQVMSIYSQ